MEPVMIEKVLTAGAVALVVAVGCAALLGNWMVSVLFGSQASPTWPFQDCINRRERARVSVRA
jgi:hypothetical protein